MRMFFIAVAIAIVGILLSCWSIGLGAATIGLSLIVLCWFIKERGEVKTEGFKVYISGPITGYRLPERRQAFESVAELLSSKGFEPVTPFDNGLSDLHRYEEHMKADIEMLLRCDYILMLPEWEESKGSRVEWSVALACGIEELYLKDYE